MLDVSLLSLKTSRRFKMHFNESESQRYAMQKLKWLRKRNAFSISKENFFYSSKLIKLLPVVSWKVIRNTVNTYRKNDEKFKINVKLLFICFSMCREGNGLLNKP